MKISKRTMEILENFTNLNSSIFIGATEDDKTFINTKATRGDIAYAEATLDERFDKDVCIFEVKKLLALLNSFEDPEVQLEDDYLNIASGSSKCRLTYANKKTIVIPRKRLEGVDKVIDFDISAQQLQDLMQTGAILNLPHLKVFSQDGDIKMQALDAEGTTKDTFDITLGKTDKVFETYVKRDNLKMLFRDYKVTLYSNCIMFHGNPDDTLMYGCGLEII